MAEPDTSLEQVRDAIAHRRRAEALDGFSSLDPSRLTGRDLEGLADAAWWVSRFPDSLDARQRAYAAYERDGDEAAATSRSRFVATHPTWLSGPERGHVPVDIDRWFARQVAVRAVVFAGRHLLTIRTPIGRAAKAKSSSRGDPLVRVKPAQLLAGGIRRVPKTVGARDGRPVLEDGQTLDVDNVIWCTGFRHDLSWIDLPIFAEDGSPVHERGVVTSEPGLHFVGLPFQFAAASDVLPVVGRDAAYVAKQIARRTLADTSRAAIAA